MAIGRHIDVSGADPVIPLSLVAASALILPPLQEQAWWLVLPALICLILCWQVPAFLLLFAAMTHADSWFATGYFVVLSLLLLMRLHSNPVATALPRLASGLRQLLLVLPILALIMLLMLAVGSRWSDRSAPNRGSTGVSDTMTPGSVSQLFNDRRPAMRVRFEPGTDLSHPRDLYWRGLVLEDFDGRSWRRNYQASLDLSPMPDNLDAAEQLRYQVTVEPNGQSWLYGLHQAYTLRPQTYRDARGMLLTLELLRQPVRYEVTSIPPFAQLLLDDEMRQRNRRLPAGSNPRSQQWALQLREQYADDRQLADAVLQQFRDQPFHYTFRPPLTGDQAVDDFLFETREGFCEHFAAALAFTLRAAGIPARIVVGYQGGQYNPVTAHWTVRQYQAHAWVEAWFPDRGWEQLDPTTYVAPERIEDGVHAWLATADEGLRRSLPLAARMRLQLDAVPGLPLARHVLEALGLGWDLGLYDSDGNLRTEQINRWLERRGLDLLPLWLLAAMLVLVALRATLAARLPRTRLPAALREYRRLNARLRRRGLARRPSETIRAHLLRVSRQVPQDEAGRWQRLAEELTRATYSDSHA